jgi:hypothetical protein
MIQAFRFLCYSEDMRRRRRMLHAPVSRKDATIPLSGVFSGDPT